MKENKTAQDLFTTATEQTAVAIRPETLKATRRLTLDATSIARLGKVICRIDGELENLTMPPITAGGEPGKAVAIPITDIVSQTSYLMFCNSMMQSSLKRAGEPLTGRYFAIADRGIREGKRYRQVEIFELEVAK